MIELIKGIALGTAEAGGGGGSTINNEDMTITANGTYTASEGYTGIGTATVNVPQPTGTISITSNGTADVNDYQYANVDVPQYEEKTATNATGFAVASGDKVWVNGNQIVDYIDVDTVSGIAKDNFTAGTQAEQLTVSGSLTNSDGILSGFSASNYAVLDDKGTLPSFEILTKINMNHTDYYGSVLDNAFHFIRVGGGKIGIYNAIDGAIANFSFSTNKWYWCRGVYDGSSYTLYCLEDNGFIESQLPPLSAWGVAATTQNVSGMNLDSVYLGVDGGYLSNYLHGTINIEATKITSNGAIIWQYRKYVNGGSGKVGIGELGKKYGATIENFFGDVDANGKLQEPIREVELTFTGVKDLAPKSLYNLFGIYTTSNAATNKIKTVSFPDLEVASGWNCLTRFAALQKGLTSVSFPKLKTISADYGFQYAFNSTGITTVSFPELETISSLNSAMEQCFSSCQSLTSVSFPKLKTISGSNALLSCFSGCTNLTSVDLSSLETISQTGGCQSIFYGTKIQTFTFNKLSTLTGMWAFRYAFSYCTSLTSLSFPALKSDSFDSYTNQFDSMLSGVTGCTVHFPSNLQAVIGSWTDVTGGFGGTNTTVLFDLPATE